MANGKKIHENQNQPMSKKKLLDALYTFLTLTGGALVAHYLGLQTNFVFSAALAGLIFAYATPKYVIPAYCGAFVGMASPEIIPNLQLLLAAVLAATLIKLIIGPFIPKVGGKAGFMAFLGIVVIYIFAPEKNLHNTGYISAELGLGLAATSVIATMTTFKIRRYLKDNTNDTPKINAAVGSAIVGLLAGIPYIFFPGIALFAQVAFAASFAGMSSFNPFRKKYSIPALGLIVGLVFIAVFPYFQGFGGKLGTTAFISMMIYLTLKRLKAL